MHLPKDNPLYADIPLDYEMVFIKDTSPMYMISKKNENKIGAVEGTVGNVCQLRPVMDDNYHRVMKARRMKNSKKSITKMWDVKKSAVNIEAVKHVKEAELLRRKHAHRTSVEDKRERLPENEFMDMLFRAFEKYPRWSLKGLIEYTNQPIGYLKEKLGEIAKKGSAENRNMWELKNEYK